MVNRIFNFLSSLRLTVVCLALATLLVFIGTLAQVEQGLYNAQARYFKSFFVWWSPAGSTLKLPVFPAGYLVGLVLLANLAAAHVRRFQFTWKKFGIHLIHGGLVLLLLGQLFTDLLSRESAMRMTEGETKYFSEDFHANEIAIIDRTAAEHDEVVAIPERLIAKGKEIAPEKLPFRLRIVDYWVNSALTTKEVPAALKTGVTEGIGKGVFVIPAPAVTSMDQRNLPSAVVELLSPSGSVLGRWLLSTRIDEPQAVEVDSRKYELALRFTRYYKPFSLTLHDFAHDKYMGTDIPKNFSSQVRLQNPSTGEDREVKIYMNNPLRYDGLTFYQAGFDDKDPRVTILQVVRNPGWLTPYLACVLVGAGLIAQFSMHLFGFIAKRRTP